MTVETIKIVVPMAGRGTRLRPHTLTKPKQLIPVAGKPVLSHLLELFTSLPASVQTEWIFIIGHLGEQIPPFMQTNYPDHQVHYVEQRALRGQSHAVYQARAHLHGPMLMVFSDTLMELEFSFLTDASEDARVWVKPVPDPRRFGVAILDSQGRVTQLVEKPTAIDNNLAVVGLYYFREAQALVAAIEAQMSKDLQISGEYFLADAVNLMLADGLTMWPQHVEECYDAGTVGELLATNRYLLRTGQHNSSQASQRQGVVVIPPVFIHPMAKIARAVIGPYVSVGPGCQIMDSVIRNAILDADAEIKDAVLTDSLIGQAAQVHGQASIINSGEYSETVI